MALMILSDVLPSAGNEWGISCDDLAKITVLLSHAEEKLFSLADIKEDAD